MFVIVFLAKDDCEECKKWEEELVGLRDELVDSLSAWVVKVSGSYLRKLYTPYKEPALVFFRNSVPLLYDGNHHYLFINIFVNIYIKFC